MFQVPTTLMKTPARLPSSTTAQLPHPTRPRVNQASLLTPTKPARVLLLNTVPLLKMDLPDLQDLKVSLLNVVKHPPLSTALLLKVDLLDLQATLPPNVVKDPPLSSELLPYLDPLDLQASLLNVVSHLLLSTALLLNLVLLDHQDSLPKAVKDPPLSMVPLLNLALLDLLVSQPNVVSHPLLSTALLLKLDLPVHLDLKVSLTNVVSLLLLNTALLPNLVLLVQLVLLDLVFQHSVVSLLLPNTVPLPHLDLRVLLLVQLLHLPSGHLELLVLKAAVTQVISTMLLVRLLLDLRASRLRVARPLVTNLVLLHPLDLPAHLDPKVSPLRVARRPQLSTDLLLDPLAPLDPRVTKPHPTNTVLLLLRDLPVHLDPKAFPKVLKPQLTNLVPLHLQDLLDLKVSPLKVINHQPLNMVLLVQLLLVLPDPPVLKVSHLGLLV